MKRKRDTLQSSQQLVSETKTMATAHDLYLPYECWECIFKFLIINNNDHNRYLKPLSLVSKPFLSLTNRHRFSLAIYNSTHPFLSRLFHRFSNITSLDLTHYYGDLDSLLCEISYFPLNLTSLNLSNKPAIPANGLQALASNITTLTSLTCSEIDSLNSNDLFLISDCFPLLEELDLSNPTKFENEESFPNGLKTFSSVLFKLRKVNLTGHYYINNQSLFHLFNNLKLLEQAIIFDCYKITDAGIVSAIHVTPTLRSLSFSRCYEPDCATFFALVSNCCSLSEIRMKYIYKSEKSVQNSKSLMDFVVSTQLKSLHWAYNSSLRDENIKMFASAFPNLQQLDLSYCYNISEEGICQILRSCCQIRHLNLTRCSRVKLRETDFKASKLEVLNLSHTRVDDQALYVISKSCYGLLQLLLECCCDVTEKGVKHVVENCTQLREINLRSCYKVHPNVVASMIFSLPSLRKISVPPRYRSSDRDKDLFLSYACLLC